MGELRFPGLATGIDSTALVNQLMIINSQRLARYQVKKISYEDKSSVYDELRAKVRALDSAADALSDSNDLQIFNANSSNRDILTVNASTSVNPGSHTVDINQLATSETWIQDVSTFSYKTDYVGGGDFIYSYNHQERVITAVEDETTLEDLVGLINNDANNPGVSASLLYQGGKYHLMLSGEETGEDYQISVNTSTTEVWESSTEGGSFTKDGENATLSTKITELGEFTANGGLQGDEFITISGKNHFGTDISPDLNLDVTANTTVGHLIDSINKHFDGIATAVFINGEIRLTDNVNGTSGMEISLSFNAGSGDTELVLPAMAVSIEGGGTSESLASLSSASFIQTQNAQSSKIKIDGYPSTAVDEEQTISIIGGTPTSGTFKLTLNGETTAAINYNASAADIQSALLDLDSVDAGDVSCTGDGLPSNDVKVTFGSNLGETDVAQMMVSDSTLDTGNVSIEETNKGNDGWLNRNGNSISDALSGVTLKLKDATEVGDPIEITVTRDTVSVQSKIQSMVTAYNELITFLAQKTEYNDETKEMGILSTDIATSLIRTQMREPFIGVATGFTEEDTFFQISDIGISFGGNGMMEFDTSEFNEAIAEDFTAVLELLGATKTGDTVEGATIEFYSASDKFTTAGEYDIEVKIAFVEEVGNVIESAKIKLSTESTYRNAAWNGNLITGDSTFDDNGRPLYPENALRLSVDLTSTGTFTGSIRVKQGMVGSLEDFLEEILENNGRINIAEDILDDQIKQMEDTIEREESRLEDVEARLIAKFARLEKTLSLLQQQFGAAGIFQLLE